MSGLLTHALAAHEAGLCVLPPKGNGMKAPLVPWTTYQHRRSTPDEIRRWYAQGRTGIGVVLGETSGGLELLEFDDVLAYRHFTSIADKAGIGELVERIEAGYLEESPNGIHWLYRCSQIEGNTKLARRPKKPDEMEHPGDKVKVLIETRGEGGFAIIAPTHGDVHPSGRPYKLLRGSYATIATITPEERAQLFELARTLDSMPRREQRAAEALAQRPNADDGERPGDWFNRTATWAEVLEPHGWTWVFEHNGEAYWRRPGKAHGQSATTNYAGNDTLKVFSSSTEFDTETTYTKFAAFAVLEHNGDYTAAAKALADEMPREDKRTVLREVENFEPHYEDDPGPAEPPSEGYEWAAEEAHLDVAEGDAELQPEATEHTPTWQKPDIDLAAFIYAAEPSYDWVVPDVLERGDRVILTGPEGGGKSTLMRQFGVQVAAGVHPFTRRDMEPVRVFYLDLENSQRHTRRQLKPLYSKVAQMLPHDTFHIRVVPQGINLHNEQHREWLEHRIAANRPDVFITGPLYKMADGDPTEEKVAKPVAMCLDHLRNRYEFALLIEAHTPHGNTQGGRRPERPYGASLWLRWPEFGVFLDPQGAVRHWRGARDERAWPTVLERGGEWPWMSVTNPKAVTFAGMVAAVKESGEWLSIRELGLRMNVDKGQIERAIKANQKLWDALKEEMNG